MQISAGFRTCLFWRSRTHSSWLSTRFADALLVSQYLLISRPVVHDHSNRHFNFKTIFQAHILRSFSLLCDILGCNKVCISLGERVGSLFFRLPGYHHAIKVQQHTVGWFTVSLITRAMASVRHSTRRAFSANTSGFLSNFGVVAPLSNVAFSWSAIIRLPWEHAGA